MNSEISVIILSWNDRPHLEDCLLSLSEGPAIRSREVIVVDNASTDGSPEMVEARFPAVKLIKFKDNLGFARANNLGIQASGGKYVCLLNSDIKLFPGCLDALADYLDRNSDVGMVGPRVLNKDLTHQSSCRRFPGLWNNFCAATGLAKAFPNTPFFSGEHMMYFKGERTLEVDVLVGCFWMVRRAALAEFGLLDEELFMYAEDTDWCRRCWDAGWRVVFFPGGEAIHYKGGSSSKRDPVWVEVTQQRSVLYYWTKHHGASGRLGVSCLIALHRATRCAVAWVLSAFGWERAEQQARLRVNGACLRDVFSYRYGRGNQLEAHVLEKTSVCQ